MTIGLWGLEADGVGGFGGGREEGGLRCCSGVPSVVVAILDSQRHVLCPVPLLIPELLNQQPHGLLGSRHSSQPPRLRGVAGALRCRGIQPRASRSPKSGARTTRRRLTRPLRNHLARQRGGVGLAAGRRLPASDRGRARSAPPCLVRMRPHCAHPPRAARRTPRCAAASVPARLSPPLPASQRHASPHRRLDEVAFSLLSGFLFPQTSPLRGDPVGVRCSGLRGKKRQQRPEAVGVGVVLADDAAGVHERSGQLAVV